MRATDIYAPIIISRSCPDSRNLIMPHQTDAIKSMTEYFMTGEDRPGRAGLVVMPTGSGKTYTAVTWLLDQCVSKGYRVVWLVHRKELVEQTYQEFRNLSPLLQGSGVKKLRVLPISGNHLRMVNAARADVYICSIASVANKYGYRFIERMIGAQGKRRLVIVVDEAHHAVASGYRKVIKRMTGLNPNACLLGLTATPTRMQDSERRKLNSMFNVDENIRNQIGRRGYVYEITLKELIKSGFLANPVYEKIKTQIIGKIEYELTPEDEAFFAQYGELSARLMDRIGKSAVRNRKIVEQYINNKDRYGKTLVFALDQNHAETLYNEFTSAGVNCDYVISSKVNAGDTIERFRNNEFDVLINVQIMTEGSDVPDIQTVFLTRQTNSDSLLMQMIGRGMRGLKAKGTKDAYIVSFHDVWDRFMQFVDPDTLALTDIEAEDQDYDEEEDKDEIVEIAPNEEMLKLLTDIDPAAEPPIDAMDTEQGISSRELYLKLYRLMHASLVSETETPIFPVGWYSVTDDEGCDVSIFVFHGQQQIYRDIENNLSLIRGRISPEGLLDVYFSDIEVKPDLSEMTYFLDHIEDCGEMPEFFTFRQRDSLDPAQIAAKVKSLFSKEEDQVTWLKELYDSAQVLQQIYRSFFAFRKTVFDADVEMKLAIISTEDERKEYSIEENYYDLRELLDEVLQMYPLLKIDRLVKISWTENVVRYYFAQCEAYDNFRYFQLYVNKLLSSPKVDREVIKYLIFHELLHINGYWDHDTEFRKREWLYPGSEDLDGFLDSMRLEYNMETLDAKWVSTEIHEFSAQTEETPVFSPGADGVVPGYKYCRNCGNRLPDDARFCDKCGYKIEY